MLAGFLYSHERKKPVLFLTFIDCRSNDYIKKKPWVKFLIDSNKCLKPAVSLHLNLSEWYKVLIVSFEQCHYE